LRRRSKILDYEHVKRWKRDLMVNDPKFIEGRGRLESVEFHTAERIYLKGIEDGGMTAAKLDEVIALLQAPCYTDLLAIMQEIKAQLIVR